MYKMFMLQIALELGLPTYATNYFDVNVWNVTGTQYRFSDITQGINRTLQAIQVWNAYEVIVFLTCQTYYES